MIDPDKKVSKVQKKRRSVYQSRKHPEHFENEGGEYIERKANKKDIKNTMPVDIKKYPEDCR